MSAYPVLDVCFEHKYIKPLQVRENNTVLIDDLFKNKNNITDIEMRQLFEECAKQNIYILSGKHHGPLPWNILPRYNYIKRRKLIELLWKKLKIKQNINKTKRLELTGLSEDSRFIAIHIRTFIDSKEGYANFIKKKKEQLTLFKRLSILKRNEYQINKILIASDSIKEAREIGRASCRERV